MTTLKISGMRCGHCVASVTKTLNEIDGISDVQVSLDSGEATFKNNEDVAIEQVKDSIAKIGFEAS